MNLGSPTYVLLALLSFAGIIAAIRSLRRRSEDSRDKNAFAILTPFNARDRKIWTDEAIARRRAISRARLVMAAIIAIAYSIFQATR